MPVATLTTNTSFRSHWSRRCNPVLQMRNVRASRYERQRRGGLSGPRNRNAADPCFNVVYRACSRSSEIPSRYTLPMSRSLATCPIIALVAGWSASSATVWKT